MKLREFGSIAIIGFMVFSWIMCAVNDHKKTTRIADEVAISEAR